MTYKNPEGFCVICGAKGIEYHHIYSRKAHGTIDDAWNLLPLCRRDHTQIHSLGLNRMAQQVPQLRAWLLKNEWTFDMVVLKWRHEK